MTPASSRHAGRLPGRAALAVLAVLAPAVLALALAACATPSVSGSGTSAGAAAAPSRSTTGSPTIASPVEGLIVRLDARGLTKVDGFRLRTAGGAEVDLRLGVLENGVEFPPGHLAEHMTTSSAIRAFFRDQGGERVVYRLEDAE